MRLPATMNTARGRSDVAWWEWSSAYSGDSVGQRPDFGRPAVSKQTRRHDEDQSVGRSASEDLAKTNGIHQKHTN